MVSVRRATRLLVAALAALLVAGPITSAGATEVDPGTLETGAWPRIDFLNGSKEWIKEYQGPRLDTQRFRSSGVKYDGDLLHATGGYLVNVPIYQSSGSGGGLVQVGTRIAYLSISGHTRTIVAASAYDAVLVSNDGRWVVAANPRRTSLRVIRFSDGQVVRTHTFRGAQDVWAMAAGRGRVLVRTQRSLGGSRGFDLDTFSWSPAGDGLRRLHHRHQSHVGPRDMAATIGGGEYAVTTGPGEAVRDVRSGRALWRTTDHVVSFSPDDRRVVTVTGPVFDQEMPFSDYTRTLRVRNARTGRVLATFKGYFGADARTISSPVWESSTELLLHATSAPFISDPESEPTYPHASLIRCSVSSGRCAKVMDNRWDVHLLQRKSN